MPPKTFEEFYNQKAKDESVRKSGELRDEWTKAVQALTDQILDWLKAVDKQRLMTIVVKHVDKQEEGVAPYSVPTIEIALGDSLVRVWPVGRKSFGYVDRGDGVRTKVAGRVDITNDAMKYVLYRTEKDGKWFAVNEEHASTPFDKARFEAILLELLS